MSEHLRTLPPLQQQGRVSFYWRSCREGVLLAAKTCTITLFFVKLPLNFMRILRYETQTLQWLQIHKEQQIKQILVSYYDSTNIFHNRATHVEKGYWNRSSSSPTIQLSGSNPKTLLTPKPAIGHNPEPVSSTSQLHNLFPDEIF